MRLFLDLPVPVLSCVVLSFMTFQKPFLLSPPKPLEMLSNDIPWKLLVFDLVFGFKVV